MSTHISKPLRDNDYNTLLDSLFQCASILSENIFNNQYDPPPYNLNPLPLITSYLWKETDLHLSATSL